MQMYIDTISLPAPTDVKFTYKRYFYYETMNNAGTLCAKLKTKKKVYSITWQGNKTDADFQTVYNALNGIDTTAVFKIPTPDSNAPVEFTGYIKDVSAKIVRSSDNNTQWGNLTVTITEV